MRQRPPDDPNDGPLSPRPPTASGLAQGQLSFGRPTMSGIRGLVEPPIHRLPPKPPMPPHLLAGDPPSPGQLVDLAARDAEVLGDLGDGHDGGIRFSHGMPQCWPCPLGFSGPRVDPLSRTMLIVAHCCARRNRPYGRRAWAGERGRQGPADPALGQHGSQPTIRLIAWEPGCPGGWARLASNHNAEKVPQYDCHNRNDLKPDACCKDQAASPPEAGHSQRDPARMLAQCLWLTGVCSSLREASRRSGAGLSGACREDDKPARPNHPEELEEPAA